MIVNAKKTKNGTIINKYRTHLECAECGMKVDAEEYKRVVETAAFKAIWGSNVGEGVKTAPKGFYKEHPNIDLIRFKQHLFSHSFTDKEVLEVDFPDKVVRTFQAIRPFFDYMSNVLTTDLNGESIL